MNKLHPAFIEIAGLRRALVEAMREKPSSKRIEAVRRVLADAVRKRYELLQRYPDLSPGPSWGHVKAAGYRYPSKEEKIAGAFAWFFFKRFRIPLAVAMEKERAGDLDAHKQIVRATDEFWQLQHGFRVLPFKVHEIHSDLMELGFGLGLRKLSAEELADCFSQLCPCGKQHDADAMKKQRRRVHKQLQAALEERWRVTPPRERYSVYGADGYVATAYRPNQGEPYVEISRKGRGLEYVVSENDYVGFTNEPPESRWQIFFRLPEAFFVQGLEDIFKMFFPSL